FLFFCVATAIAALPFDTVFKGRAKFDQLIERAEKENWSALPIGERVRSEEHTSELQSPYDLVCRLLLEKKKQIHYRRRPLTSMVHARHPAIRMPRTYPFVRHGSGTPG